MKAKECMAANNPSERSVTVKRWRPAKVVNTTSSVNLRSEPSPGSRIVGLINPNSEFEIEMIRTPEWYGVKLKDGTIGYASAKYIAEAMMAGDDDGNT